MDEPIKFYEDLNENEISNAREKTCFFTGHRKGLGNVIKDLLPKLKSSISYLYSKGVTDFCVGGALGFDTMAATQVLDLKRDHPNMRLILYLPYRNQSEHWKEDHKRFYQYILKNCDEVHYAFDGDVKDYSESKEYLLMRNRMMADRGMYCIAFYSGSKRSGTGYTVEYAKKNGCEIINLHTSDSNRK